MSTETDTKRLKRLEDFWIRAVHGNKPWHKQALLNKGFFTGKKQWSSMDREKLKDEERYPLTINHILGQVDIMTGIERQNRQDIVVYPRRGGLTQVAAGLTEIVKHATDVSKGSYKQSFVFIDGLVLIKGWLGLDIDYTYDPINGDLEIMRYSPLSMLEDPDCKSYDINDLKQGAEFVFQTYYWDKEEIELNYGADKAKRLKEAYQHDQDTELKIDNPWPEFQATGYSRRDYEKTGAVKHVQGSEEFDKGTHLIKNCSWKSREKKAILYSRVGRIQPMMLTSPEAIERAKALTSEYEDFGIKDDVITVMNKTVFTGGMELEHKVDPHNGRVRFPYYRFCPYWIDGEMFGFLDNLLEIQREINKGRTQSLDIQSRSPKGMWLYEADSLTKDTVDNLEEFGQKPGFHMVYKKSRPEPKWIEPPPLTNAQVAQSELSVRDLEKIGLPPTLQGLPQDKHESGRAILVRKQQAEIKVEGMFDNFRWTKEGMGEAMVELIRRPNDDGQYVYTQEEIEAVLDKKDLVDRDTLWEAKQKVASLIPEELAQADPELQRVVVQQYEEEVERVARELFFGKMREWKTGRYGTKVSERPSGPTARMMNFQLLLDLLQAYPELRQFLPPEMVMEASDIHNKEKFMMAIERERQKMMMSQAPPGAQGAPA